jgi:hypothetical protein
MSSTSARVPTISAWQKSQTDLICITLALMSVRVNPSFSAELFICRAPRSSTLSNPTRLNVSKIAHPKKFLEEVLSLAHMRVSESGRVAPVGGKDMSNSPSATFDRILINSNMQIRSACTVCHQVIIGSVLNGLEVLEESHISKCGNKQTPLTSASDLLR